MASKKERKRSELLNLTDVIEEKLTVKCPKCGTHSTINYQFSDKTLSLSCNCFTEYSDLEEFNIGESLEQIKNLVITA